MRNINFLPIRTINKIAFLFLFLMGASILSSCNSEPETFRVGIITSLPAFNSIADGFKDGMTELGYIEGENIVYDFHEGNDDPSTLTPIIDKFVEDEVDLIFAYPTGAAIAAKEGSDIPVVFAFASLEDSDLVDDLRAPGGSATGVRFPGPDLTVIRLEYLLEMAPEAERILLLHDPDYPASASALEALEPAATSMGVELVVENVASVDDVFQGLENHDNGDGTDIDAILIMPEGFSQSPEGWDAVSAFAAKYEIPIGGSAAFEADTGAIFTLIPDTYAAGEQAAPSADKILSKDISPGTIPVITPDSQLRINLALAESLELTPSERLLNLAADVIRE